MTCAWKELLSVLPIWMRKEVDAQRADLLQELRLRINAPPELVYAAGSRWIDRNITIEDLNYIVNAATQYSPWNASTISQGYITAAGGHRIGLCGEAIARCGIVTGIRKVTSLCIRVARDFPGIAARMNKVTDSILILGPPGSGKTTLLRDLIRNRSETEKICVLDERNELFPEGLPQGKNIDVLSGCSKKEGIPMLLRTMGPDCIAVDEITDPEDAYALQQAANCGVQLLATAHAASIADFQQRSIYHPLWVNRIFPAFVILKRDKTYTLERMAQWVSSGLVQY